MKRCLQIAAWVLIASVHVWGAITLTASATAVGVSSGTATTSAIDSTGANACFVYVAYPISSTPATPTDSKGNTYTALNLAGNSQRFGRWYYSLGATVGSGHTFSDATASGNGFKTIFASCFAGVLASSALDVQNTNQTGSGAVTTGSVTPGSNSELCLAGTSQFNNGTDTYAIDSSFTLDKKFLSASFEGGATAYQIQTTATTRNPSWTNSNVDGSAASVGCFKAAASGTDYPRGASDTALSAESAARISGFTRGPSSTTLSSEVISRSGVFSRGPANTTLSGETAARLAGFPRAAANMTLSAETLARSAGVFSRNPTNTMLSAEAPGRLYASLRGAADSTLSTQALIRSGVFARNAPNGALSGESLNRLIAINRGIADDTSALPLPSRSSQNMRALGDDSTVTENSTRLLTFARAIPVGAISGVLLMRGPDVLARSNAVGTLSAESAARSADFARLMTDGTFSEAISRAATMFRSAGDTGFISVSVVNGHSFTISLNAAALSAVSISRSQVLARQAVDGSMSEIAGRKVGFFRLEDNTAFISESLGSVYSGGAQQVVVNVSDTTLSAESISTVIGRGVIPDHMGIYVIDSRDGIYRGFVRDGEYLRPVTILVITK